MKATHFTFSCVKISEVSFDKQYFNLLHQKHKTLPWPLLFTLGPSLFIASVKYTLKWLQCILANTYSYISIWGIWLHTGTFEKLTSKKKFLKYNNKCYFTSLFYFFLTEIHPCPVALVFLSKMNDRFVFFQTRHVNIFLTQLVCSVCKFFHLDFVVVVALMSPNKGLFYINKIWLSDFQVKMILKACTNCWYFLMLCSHQSLMKCQAWGIHMFSQCKYENRHPAAWNARNEAARMIRF